MPSTPLITSKTLVHILLGIVPLYTLVKGDTLLIDNTDPHVFYSGTWHHIPSSADPQENNYNGTLAYTTEDGAFAAITFNATRVSVFGMLANTTGHQMKAHFSLDQRLPEYYEPPDNISRPLYRVKFWTSAATDLSQHALRVENNGDQFWLDYFAVEVPSLKVESSTSSTSTSASSTSGSSTGIVSLSSSTLSSSSIILSASSSSPSPANQTTAPATSGPSLAEPTPTATLSTAVAAPQSSASSASQDSPIQSSTDTHLVTSAAQTQRARAVELTGGEIAGLVVGALVAGQIVVLVAVWRHRGRRRAKSGRTSSAEDRRHPGRIMERRMPSSLSLLPEDHRDRDSVSRTMDSHQQGLDEMEGCRTGRPPSTITYLSRAASTPTTRDAVDIVHWTETDGGVRIAGGRPRDNNASTTDLAILYPPPYCSTYGSRADYVHTAEVPVHPETK
ncbi:hypothetical protein VTO73DRAFT_14127 [Trametes versicolor]